MGYFPEMDQPGVITYLSVTNLHELGPLCMGLSANFCAHAADLVRVTVHTWTLMYSLMYVGVLTRICHF